jgi:hypothetical protein
VFPSSVSLRVLRPSPWGYPTESRPSLAPTRPESGDSIACCFQRLRYSARCSSSFHAPIALCGYFTPTKCYCSSPQGIVVPGDKRNFPNEETPTGPTHANPDQLRDQHNLLRFGLTLMSSDKRGQLCQHNESSIQIEIWRHSFALKARRLHVLFSLGCK